MSNRYLLLRVVCFTLFLLLAFYLPTPVIADDLLLLNIGGSNAATGKVRWSADSHSLGGRTRRTKSPIAKTKRDKIYQSARVGNFAYRIPTADGRYSVEMLFCEIQPTKQNSVFDVFAEEKLVLSKLNLRKLVGNFSAHQERFEIDVRDGILDLRFTPRSGHATLSGLRLTLLEKYVAQKPDPDPTPQPEPQPEPEPEPEPDEPSIPTNTPPVVFAGADQEITLPTNLVTLSGDVTDDEVPALALKLWTQISGPAGVNFGDPTSPSTTVAFTAAGVYILRLTASDGEFSVSDDLTVTVNEAPPPPHLLHVVAKFPPTVVDYDGDGTESVTFEGGGSHTHELGRQIVRWDWFVDDDFVGSGKTLTSSVTVGTHKITQTIYDNGATPKNLTEDFQLVVDPIDAVSGTLAKYFYLGAAAESSEMAAALDSLPSLPDFIERLPGIGLADTGQNFGGSSFSDNTILQISGSIDLPSNGSYRFDVNGGDDSRLLVDGELQGISPVSLAAGLHSIELRVALSSLSARPVSVDFSLNGAPAVTVPHAILTHDQTGLPPFVNSLVPEQGTGNGGDEITISGIGFFPAQNVTVHWGDVVLAPPVITVTASSVILNAPPGSGTVEVKVETPNGLSNQHDFTYSSTQSSPVDFEVAEVATPDLPTQAVWGADGRLYVASVFGKIYAYTFNDNYAVTNTQLISALEPLSNNNILGIAVSPFDPPSPVKLYVAHNKLFAHKDGTCFSEFSPYRGQVSVLTGPNFNSIDPLLTGLPVSNHDHGVNGLDFNNLGDLIIAMGGNTNAGVLSCELGGLPESPLSGAIVKARLTSADFNGHVDYVNPGTTTLNNDQSNGELVDLQDDDSFSIFSPGLRNAFDLVYATNGLWYATDNGANTDFGFASTGPNTDSGNPANDPDELMILSETAYFGHPNRNRGRFDARENVFRTVATPSLPSGYTAAISAVEASSNGIDEYRATTFGSAMRGDLLVQQLNGPLHRFKLTANGTIVQSASTIDGAPSSLDVLTGPGGAIISVDHYGRRLFVQMPSDTAPPDTIAWDIFPWRALATGGAPFVIGGKGFGDLSNTTVHFGTTAAVLISVSATRIRGLIPGSLNPTPELLDIVVSSNSANSILPKAFRYLNPQGSGSWRAESPMPVALGEVAAALMGGWIYIVGHGNAGTFAYDPINKQWRSSIGQRPFRGDHHAVEVLDGKLYLVGGIDGGSEGKLQIYDPFTNTWTTGPDMPFAAGSIASAVIDRKLYVAGGIVASSTTNQAAVFNPTTNSWGPIASMPIARNHTAAGTDGKRFFVFGGRGPGSGDGNFPAPGFDDVQIYDPVTNSWNWSGAPGSGITPLPQRRGGMGKAAYFSNRFYVIGGETDDDGEGQVTGNVYNRVDVYDPFTNTWTLESPLPTARHGIYPVVHNDQIYVLGGGVVAAHSQSAVIEVYSK